MKPEQLVEALEAAAAQLGIPVRYETMTGETAGAAGLCKVKGEWRILIDRRTPPSDRVAILAEALAGFDTEAIFLAPEVRRAIELHRPPRPAPDAPAPERG